jgi:hypothetical protein
VLQAINVMGPQSMTSRSFRSVGRIGHAASRRKRGAPTCDAPLHPSLEVWFLCRAVPYGPSWRRMHDTLERFTPPVRAASHSSPVRRRHGPTALQPYSPQPYNPTALQPHSPTTPQRPVTRAPRQPASHPLAAVSTSGGPCGIRPVRSSAIHVARAFLRRRPNGRHDGREVGSRTRRSVAQRGSCRMTPITTPRISIEGAKIGARLELAGSSRTPFFIG